jgi:hypothetical protein
MSIFEIPVRSDIPFYDMDIILDGTAFFLEFYFNRRKDRWYMNIRNQDKEPILMGTPLLVNTDLLFPFFSNEALPVGLFLVIDTEDGQLNPGEFDLGDRVKLTFNDFIEETA